MTTAKKNVDRRKHKRFQVQDVSFAALRPNYHKIGQIIDMSTDGLAFRYLADVESPETSFALDIFLASRAFHLSGLPFKIIYDVETNELRLSSIKTRRSGLQFGELTFEQKSQLEYFIRNYSARE